MNDAPADCARLARLLARAASSGALATFRRARRGQGQPYVSKVGVAADLDGAPLFLFSTLAAHTQDLLADARCSLLVEGAGATANPLEAPRATLVGRAVRLDGDAARAARAISLVRPPGAARYVDFGDFAFWRQEVEKVHFVGGFGRAKWAKGADYAVPPGDLADKREAIVRRLADDKKAAALRAAGVGRGWRAAAADPDGLAYAGPRGRWTRLDFVSPAKDMRGWNARFAAVVRRAG